MPAMISSVKLRDVWYRYETSRDWVIKGVDLYIRSGRLVIIQGPNGSGKTTLMKILSLIYKPSKGSVYVNDIDFWSSGRERDLLRRDIVYVHEKPILLRDTVLNNIIYPLKIRGVSIGERLDEIKRIMRVFGVENLENKRSRELSAGQAQIVSIIRALILRPSIIVLDEPFSNLDKSRRGKLIDLIREYIDLYETGVVISLHEEYLIDNLDPDEVYYMNEGRLYPEEKEFSR